MNTKVQIQFGQPSHKQSPVDEIKIDYPYELIKTNTEKSKREVTNYVLSVSISGHLASDWGLQIWQKAPYYNNLMKTLFPLVLEQIKSKLKKGILNQSEQIELSSKSYINKPSFDTKGIPTVEGYVEVIEVEEKFYFNDLNTEL